MAKKSKIRIDRLIILILVCLIILSVLGLGIYKLIDVFFSDNNANNNITPIIPTVVDETTENVELSLLDYKVYYDDKNEFDSNFIIAQLKFASNKAFSYEFKNLQTSEKIYLNDVDKMINQLQLKGYNLADLSLTTNGVVCNENSCIVNVFIPFSKNANSLTVYNSLDKTKLDFNIENNRYAITTLKLEDQSTDIEVGTTKVSVSNSYISSGMLHSGERYNVGSSIKIYTYELLVNESNDDSYIQDAIFILDGTNEEIHCLNKDYEAIDCKNIIGKKLSSGTNGGLFFEIVTSSNSIQKGTLLVKFSNADKWTEVE